MTATASNWSQRCWGRRPFIILLLKRGKTPCGSEITKVSYKNLFGSAPYSGRSSIKPSCRMLKVTFLAALDFAVSYGTHGLKNIDISTAAYSLIQIWNLSCERFPHPLSPSRREGHTSDFCDLLRILTKATK